MVASPEAAKSLPEGDQLPAHGLGKPHTYQPIVLPTPTAKAVIQAQIPVEPAVVSPDSSSESVEPSEPKGESTGDSVKQIPAAVESVPPAPPVQQPAPPVKSVEAKDAWRISQPVVDLDFIRSASRSQSTVK